MAVPSAFTDFANLTGGTAADNFVLNVGTLSGSIDGDGFGGAGINTLTGDNVVNVWVLTGAADGTVTGVAGTFSHIDDVIGNADVDTLPST